MQPRHWDRIATITGHVFDVDADNFLLRNLMMAPLLQNSEDIEVPSRAPARPPSNSAHAVDTSYRKYR